MHDSEQTSRLKPQYESGLTSLSFLCSMLRPFWKEILSLIGLSLWWSIDFSLRPYLVKVILDRLACANRTAIVSLIFAPISFYLLATFFTNIIVRLYDLVLRRVRPQLKKNIVSHVMKKIMRHSHKYFQTHFTGDLGISIQNIARGSSDIFSILIDRFVSYSLALGIAIFTINRINGYLGSLMLLWIALYLTVSCICSPIARRLSVAQSQSQMYMIGNIIDIFSNMLTVRLFAGVPHEEENIDKWTSDVQEKERARDLFLITLWLTQGLLFSAVLSLSCFLLVMGYKSGAVSVGDFGLILTINVSITDCLSNFSRDVGKLVDQWGLVSQGLQVVALEQEMENSHKDKELVVSAGQIHFDKVTFAYRTAQPLFHELSITIQPGQKVGLVGSSGSGKTSFVYLILRLFDIKSGSISLDGQDISKVSVDTLRHAISMIPQDPTLFHRTLHENIKYGSFDATEHDVANAALKAHITDFIAALPQGYDMIVGERGARLSGGQRQRIAIARAALKNAPLLILDEATSALDSITEQHIQESLADLMHEKTTIIIAHRLSTLLHMDRILVFDHGTIVEDGSHQELLSQRGTYQRLWNAQVGGFLPDEEDEAKEDSSN